MHVYLHTKGGTKNELWVHRVASTNVLINRTNLYFTSSKFDLKQWKKQKGGTDTKGGTEIKLGGGSNLV